MLGCFSRVHMCAVDAILVSRERRDQPFPEGFNLWSIRRLLWRYHVIGRLDRQ